MVNPTKLPCDYKKYHPEWKSRIRPDILKRANNRCEICGVGNGQFGFRDDNSFFTNIHKFVTQEGGLPESEYRKISENVGLKLIKIVLTISHTDHDISNNDYGNLKSLCQKCHLNYDKGHHKATRKRNKGLQELF